MADGVLHDGDRTPSPSPSPMKMARPRGRVYVAGMFGERDRVRALQTELVERGFLITHDWTTQESLTTDPAEKRRFADNDLRGVVRADWFVALMDHPTYAYRGTFTELGCALGFGAAKRVFIISPQQRSAEHPYQIACQTNVFFWASGIRHFETVTEFLSFVDADADADSAADTTVAAKIATVTVTATEPEPEPEATEREEKVEVCA